MRGGDARLAQQLAVIGPVFTGVQLAGLKSASICCVVVWIGKALYLHKRPKSEPL